MAVEEWEVGFEVAGVFVPGKDIQLTSNVLVKQSQKEELILDQLLPVHEVLVRITKDEFKRSDEYDIAKFGTNKFAQEGEFGVAEQHLVSALSLYTIMTSYPTAILRKGEAWNLTYLKVRGLTSLPHGVQFHRVHLSQDAKIRLQGQTKDFIEDFCVYKMVGENTHSFIGLSARYYWMARNAYQDHAAFLNHIIALEVLLSPRGSQVNRLGVELRFY